MLEVLNILKQATDVQAHARDRLDKIVCRKPGGFSLKTDGTPLKIKTLWDSNEGQVFLAVLDAGVTCREHMHLKSVEVVFVWGGEIKVGRDIYKTGDVCYIPAGVQHAVKANKASLLVISASPPEKAYSFKRGPNIA